MKKGLLLSFLLLLAPLLRSQTRLSLYEEFTGENCFACGAVNPTVQALAATNSGSMVLITYPSPQPAAGPLYSMNSAFSNARIAYYGITTAPQGRLNGTGLGSGTGFTTPGHAGNLTQSDIDAAAITSKPFSLSVNHTYNSTGDSIFINVTITAPNAYSAPSGASLKLRTATIEHVMYPTNPPGINGEQDFPNVVREMYPSANGTALSSSWTMGQSTSITVSGTVQRYVDKSNMNVVVWIQNEANKSVLQAALSTPVAISLDAGIAAARPPQSLICSAGPASVAHTAYLRNAGTAILTSARIYYHNDGTGLPPNYYNWSGSLAPGATTVVALPAVTIAGGNHLITDSVQRPNGAGDINAGNNVATGRVNVYNTTQQNLPIATGFEGLNGSAPAGWVLYDADSNGHNWAVTKNIFGGPAGFGGSTYFLLHNNYYVSKGETNYAILPAAKLPSGAKSLQFSYAHTQFNAESDALDVVYSTDCGASWISVWNASGASLSTAPATTSYFIPTAAQWTTVTVDMTAVPQNAMIAFRGVSDYGNSLYIDNIILTAPNLSVGYEYLSAASLHVVPNPARNVAFADFYLGQNADVHMSVLDATGRSVREVMLPGLKIGEQHATIPLDGLAAGVYSVRIAAGGQLAITRLVLR